MSLTSKNLRLKAKINHGVRAARGYIKIKDPLDNPSHQDHQQEARSVLNFVPHNLWEPQEWESPLTNEAMPRNVWCVDLIIIGQTSVLKRLQGPSGKAKFYRNP